MSTGDQPNTEASRTTETVIKMDPIMKSDWIAALRSGRYKQGKEYLCRHGAYCCLGVLQCVVGSDRLPQEESSEYLDPRVSKDFGLPHSIQHELAMMNDGAGGSRRKDFSEIADWIEANL